MAREQLELERAKIAKEKEAARALQAEQMRAKNLESDRRRAEEKARLEKSRLEQERIEEERAEVARVARKRAEKQRAEQEERERQVQLEQERRKDQMRQQAEAAERQRIAEEERRREEERLAEEERRREEARIEKERREQLEIRRRLVEEAERKRAEMLARQEAERFEREMKEARLTFFLRKWRRAAAARAEKRAYKDSFALLDPDAIGQPVAAPLAPSLSDPSQLSALQSEIAAIHTEFMERFASFPPEPFTYDDLWTSDGSHDPSNSVPALFKLGVVFPPSGGAFLAAAKTFVMGRLGSSWSGRSDENNERIQVRAVQVRRGGRKGGGVR